MLQVELNHILNESDAATKIAEIFSHVENQKEVYVITRDGRPAVAVVSIEMLDQDMDAPGIVPAMSTPAPVMPSIPSMPAMPELPPMPSMPEVPTTPSQSTSAPSPAPSNLPPLGGMDQVTPPAAPAPAAAMPTPPPPISPVQPPLPDLPGEDLSSSSPLA